MQLGVCQFWIVTDLGVRLAVIGCVRLRENSLCRQELGYLLTILSVSLTRYLTPPYRDCFISHYVGIASSEFEGSFVTTTGGRITVGFCANSKIINHVDSGFGKIENYKKN